ncbi:DUF4440 domain-containing protein [Burkholderia sp. Ac-20353]|uniref:DUF4440 domain-containing protein n=1 Tax=Burkholderia sp. Ac-20353 TaxID=2703894 RepID=UPI00197C3DE7|nr:DUF4440 domain-containing protein [Burkholderia sp. Ac-20353]MBN3790256.1 DUF4440 domain-containing protein [Burkholderia sp. Ac-20353]
MKAKFDLMQMRDVWIDAYIHGDLELTNYVESPQFFVKHGGSMITKQQRLARMRAHAAEQASRMSGMRYEDETRHVSEQGEWATVSGIGAMRKNGMIRARYKFLELWLINDGRWQVAALCYEHMEIDREHDS